MLGKFLQYLKAVLPFGRILATQTTNQLDDKAMDFLEELVRIAERDPAKAQAALDAGMQTLRA